MQIVLNHNKNICCLETNQSYAIKVTGQLNIQIEVLLKKCNLGLYTLQNNLSVYENMIRNHLYFSIEIHYPNI